MTSDEWRVQGIEFALSAESESAASFLEKAVRCFVLAGDAELSSRVTTQLALLRLLDELCGGGRDEALSVREEQEAAAVVLRGLKGGLTKEVREVVGLLCERVSHRELFRYEVVSGCF